MRPERLELSGFTVFREPVAIDFTGADLFSITGPTGAGKSSIVDAICFALYGSVSRYGDRRAVAPVISEGKVEARIRLDFALGEDRYTAVRVVRRTSSGATTKEARLETAAGEVLVSDAEGLTREVEDRLGLSFAHFTTCVVLPQGEFARFLHDKPRQRQDLLVRLLDLGLYERMARLARRRSEVARTRLEVIAARLDQLGVATAEAATTAERRIDVLDQLVIRIDQAQPRVDELLTEIAEATRVAAEARARLDAVTGLVIPDRVADQATKVELARTELDELAGQRVVAIEVLQKAEAVSAAQPERGRLAEASRDHTERTARAQRLAETEARALEADEHQVRVRTETESAGRRLVAAEEALGAARTRDRAHELVRGLELGEPCPVCLRPVDALPEHEGADVDAALVERAEARRAEEAAGKTLRAAERDGDRIEATLDELRQQLEVVDERLSTAPDAAETAAQLAAVDRSDADLVSASSSERAAIRDHEAARDRHRGLVDEGAVLWKGFDEARDPLVAMGPPPPERDDLGTDWRALVDWASEEQPRQEESVAEATQRATAAEKERTEISDRVVEFCQSVDLTVGDRLPREVAVEARIEAQAQLERLQEEIAEASALTDERATLVGRSQVADALGRHLSAKGFEKWVLDDALDQLVATASGILSGLSGGTYSLTVQKNNFAVIDHANADAVRSARTLSGGETFLASVALALGLADEISQLTVGSSPPLESVFLDEGFGALDPETLDTVAAAIEELGSTGRAVGVVTHVAGLAERLPVRFEVAKVGGSATVRRIDQ